LAGRYRVVVREGSEVAHQHHDDLDSALDALETRGMELERTADAKPETTILGRKFEPVQQVLARLELRGPRVRAGVDVRGDGSSEAYTGWVRRRLVPQAGDESAYDALRRELTTR
jgi:hypothetical protein